MPILEARDISKTYSAGSRKITVLDRVSLAVTSGEFLVIQGESGSGRGRIAQPAGRHSSHRGRLPDHCRYRLSLCPGCD